MLWKKINSILTGKKCSKWLDTQGMEVFRHADSNGTGFEAIYLEVSVLWVVCMHYLGNSSSKDYFGEYFATLLKRLYLKKIVLCKAIAVLDSFHLYV